MSVWPQRCIISQSKYVSCFLFRERREIQRMESLSILIERKFYEKSKTVDVHADSSCLSKHTHWLWWTSLSDTINHFHHIGYLRNRLGFFKSKYLYPNRIRYRYGYRYRDKLSYFDLHPFYSARNQRCSHSKYHD